MATSSATVGDWLRRKERSGLVDMLRDEHQRVQTKTFTKWINNYLLQADPPIVVRELFKEICDGVPLLQLLEVLSRQPIRKEKGGRGRVQHLENIRTALKVLEDRQIRLVNINPTDIADGKPTIVLGLIWTIILYFQIEETTASEPQITTDGEKDGQQRPKENAKKTLLKWAEDAVAEQIKMQVPDFSSSWRDGIAFNALVHSLAPGAIDMDEVRKMESNRQRLDHAFDAAEKNLNIPRLLDSEDVDVTRPDERSVMTYVAQFMKASKDLKRLESDPALIEQIKLSKQRAVDEKKDAQLLSDWLTKAKKCIPDSNSAVANTNNPQYEQVNAEAEKLAEKFNKLLDRNNQGVLLGVSGPEFEALRSKWDDVQQRLQNWGSKIAEKSKKDANNAFDNSLSNLRDWVPNAEQLSRVDLANTKPSEAAQSIDAALAQLASADNDLDKAQKALEALLPHLDEQELKAKLDELKSMRDRVAKLHADLPKKLEVSNKLKAAEGQFDDLLKPCINALEDEQRLLATPIESLNDPRALTEHSQALGSLTDRNAKLESDLQNAERKIDDLCASLPPDVRAALSSRLRKRLDGAKKELKAAQETAKQKRGSAQLKLAEPEVRSQLDKLTDELKRAEESLEAGADPASVQADLKKVADELRKCEERAKELEKLAATNKDDPQGQLSNDLQKIVAEVAKQRAQAEKTAKLADVKAAEQKKKRQRAESVVKQAAITAKNLDNEISDIQNQLANLDKINPVEDRVKAAKKLVDRLQAAKLAQAKLKEAVDNEVIAAGINPESIPEVKNLQKQLDELRQKTDTMQNNAEDKCVTLDEKLQKANEIANEAEAQLKASKDEIASLQAQLAAANSVKSPEERARLMKNITDNLLKEKKNQARLKSKVERDMAGADLSPDDLKRLSSCVAQIDTLSANTDKLHTQAETQQSALEQQVDKANEIAQDAAAELRQLNNEIHEVEAQLANLDGVTPLEERTRQAKRLNEKLHKAKDAQKHLRDKVQDEMKKAGLKPADHAQLAACVADVDSLGSKLEKLESIQETLAKKKAQDAQAIADKTKSQAAKLNNEISDLEKQLRDLDKVVPLDQRDQAANEILSNINLAKTALRKLREDTEKQMRDASIKPGESTAVDSCNAELGKLESRATALKLAAEEQVESLDGKLQIANEIAQDVNQQKEKIADELKAIDQEFRELDSVRSPDEKVRRVKALGTRLNKAKQAQKNLNDKLERQMDSAELLPSEVESLAKCVEDLQNMNGLTDNTKAKVDQHTEVLDKKLEIANKLAEQTAMQVKDLNEEIDDIQNQLANLDNIKPVEERGRIGKDLLERLDAARKAERQLKANLETEIKAENLNPNELHGLQDCLNQLNKLDADAAATQSAVEEKQQETDEKLDKAKGITANAKKQMQKLNDEVQDIEKQLATLGAIQPIEERSKLAKELVNRLNKAKAAQRNLKDKVDRDIQDAELKPQEFAQLDSLIKEINKQDAHLNGVKLAAQEAVDTVNNQTARVDDLENQTSAKLQQLNGEIADIQRQLQNVDSIKPAEERAKVTRDLTRRLDKAKKALHLLGEQFEQDLKAEDLSPDNFKVLGDLKRAIEQADTQVATLKEQADEKLAAVNGQVKRANDLAQETDVKLQNLEDEVKDIERKMEDANTIKAPEERAKLMKKLAEKLQNARAAQQATKDNFESEMKAAGLAADQFACLSATKQNIQALASHVQDLKENVDEHLEKADEAVEHAQQIAAETAKQLEKQQAELNELDKLAQALDAATSLDDKARLAKELSSKLASAKKSQQALKDKIDADLKAFGISAKQFPELDNQRKSLATVDARLNLLKDRVDDQLQAVKDKEEQAAEIQNAAARKLDQIEDDVRNIEAKMQTLDSIKSPEERARQAKDLTAKLNAAKKAQQEVKRKLESELAAAEIQPEDFPELKDLVGKLSEAGKSIDSLKEDAGKKAEATSVQARRAAELIDTTAKAIKQQDARLKDLEEEMRQIDTIKAPEERAKRAAEIAAKLADARREVQQLKEEFEEELRAAELTPSKFGDLESLKKELSKLDSRAVAARIGATQQMEECQRQLDDARAVVEKHAKQRENLDAEIRELTKQLSATAKIESAADKVAALKSIGSKLALAKKRVAKAEDSLASDLAIEGISPANSGLQLVQDEKDELAKLSNHLNAISDEIARKTNAANEQLASVRSEFDEKIGSCGEKLRKVEDKSTELASLNPMTDPQRVISAIQSLDADMEDLKQAIEEVREDANSCGALSASERQELDSQLSKMLNKLGEMERVAANREDVTKRLDDWNNRAAALQDEVRNLETKLADPNLSEEDLRDCLEKLASLKKNARQLEDEFKQLSGIAAKAGLTGITSARIPVLEALKAGSSEDTPGLQSRIAALENRANAKQTQLQQSNKKLKEMEQEAKRHEQVINQLAAKIDNLRLTPPLNKSSIEQVDREAARLKAELEVEEAAVSRLQRNAQSMPQSAAIGDELSRMSASLATARDNLQTKAQASANMLDSLREIEESLKPLLANEDVNAIPSTTQTASEIQEAVEALRKREAELQKQKAALDVASVKLGLIADAAAATPFALAPAECEKMRQQLAQQLLDPLAKRLDKAQAAVQDKQHNLEAQNGLTQQLDSLHDEIMNWLKPNTQALSAATGADGNMAALSAQLARYKDDLPHYEALLSNFKQKRAELDAMRNRPNSNARRQQEDLDSAFRSLSQVSQSADEKLAAVNKQATRVKDKVAQLSTWVNSKCDAANAKCDEILAANSPDERELLESLEQLKQTRQELDRRAPETNQILTEADKIVRQNGANASPETMNLHADSQNLKAKVAVAKERIDQAAALIADQLKQQLQDDVNRLQDNLSSQQDKLRTCSALPTTNGTSPGEDDGADALERAKRDLQEVNSQVKDSENALQRLKDKLKRYKRVLPESACADIERQIAPLESELKSAKERSVSAKKGLDRAADKLKAFDADNDRLLGEVNDLKLRIEEEPIARRQRAGLQYASQLTPKSHKTDDWNPLNGTNERSDISTQTACEVSTQTDYAASQSKKHPVLDQIDTGRPMNLDRKSDNTLLESPRGSAYPPSSERGSPASSQNGSVPSDPENSIAPSRKLIALGSAANHQVASPNGSGLTKSFGNAPGNGLLSSSRNGKLASRDLNGTPDTKKPSAFSRPLSATAFPAPFRPRQFQFSSPRNSDLTQSASANLLRPASSATGASNAPSADNVGRPALPFRKLLPRGIPSRTADSLKPVPKFDLSRSLQSGLDAPETERNGLVPHFRLPRSGVRIPLSARDSVLPSSPASSRMSSPSNQSKANFRIPPGNKGQSQLLPFTTTADRELMSYEPGAWLKDPKYQNNGSKLDLDNLDVPAKSTCCQLDRCKANGHDCHKHDNPDHSSHDGERRWDQSDDSLYDTLVKGDKCSRSLALSKIADSLHDLHDTVGSYPVGSS